MERAAARCHHRSVRLCLHGVVSSWLWRAPEYSSTFGYGAVLDLSQSIGWTSLRAVMPKRSCSNGPSWPSSQHPSAAGERAQSERRRQSGRRTATGVTGSRPPRKCDGRISPRATRGAIAQSMGQLRLNPQIGTDVPCDRFRPGYRVMRAYGSPSRHRRGIKPVGNSRRVPQGRVPLGSGMKAVSRGGFHVKHERAMRFVRDRFRCGRLSGTCDVLGARRRACAEIDCAANVRVAARMREIPGPPALVDIHRERPAPHLPDGRKRHTRDR